MRKLTEMSDTMKDKYAELFSTAIETMEAHEWQMPWVKSHTTPANFYRQGKPYRGCNYFLLQLLCGLKGYETPFFLTFDQIVNADGTLKYKGLRLHEEMLLDEDGMAVFTPKGLPKMVRPASFPVFKWLPRFFDADGNKLSMYEYDKLPPEEQEECKRFFKLFTYSVWNLDQTNFKEVYPEEYETLTHIEVPEHETTVIDPVLDRMIHCGEWRCPIELKGNAKAYYSPSRDAILLPRRELFKSDARFYGTAVHEMAHSTAKELQRETGIEAFGDEAYAKEEFIAELTAACVCSMLGIDKLLDENHIAYVQSWKQAIREESDFVPQVIDHVQRAANCILRRYEEVAKAMEMPRLLAAA